MAILKTNNKRYSEYFKKMLPEFNEAGDSMIELISEYSVFRAVIYR